MSSATKKRKLKPCKEGQIRNPKTNRCITAKRSKSFYTPPSTAFVSSSHSSSPLPNMAITATNIDIMRDHLHEYKEIADTLPAVLPPTFYLNINLVIERTLYTFMTAYMKAIKTMRPETALLTAVERTVGSGEIYTIIVDNLASQYSYYFHHKRQDTLDEFNRSLFTCFTNNKLKSLLQPFVPPFKASSSSSRTPYNNKQFILQQFQINISYLLLEIIDVALMNNTLSFAEIAKHDPDINTWFNNIGYKEIHTVAEFNRQRPGDVI